jgi:hypothetical protein
MPRTINLAGFGALQFLMGYRMSAESSTAGSAQSGLGLGMGKLLVRT